MRRFFVLITISIFLGTGMLLFNEIPVSLPLENYLSDLTPEFLGEVETALAENEFENEVDIFFSHKDYFYAHSISVSLQSNYDYADIYFTTDGSDPTVKSRKYSAPIDIVVDDDTECLVIKAIAIANDIQSDIQTHSYFLGKNISNRFSTYVFSITSEPKNFYGYENGILVPGKVYDNFIQKNPDYMDIPSFRHEGNYSLRGSESERTCYVEVFDKEGNNLLAQWCGVRVKGGASRSFPQKSLRLIASKKYLGEMGKFNYPLFSSDYKKSFFNAPITSYNSIVLSSSGNDLYGPLIRSPLVTHIFNEQNLLDTYDLEASVVFINGEYYGFAWLENQLDEQYFEEKYDAPERSFEIIDTVNAIFKDENDELFIALENLENEANYAQLVSRIDVDNMLLLYAAKAYINTRDFNENTNIKMWRYTGQSKEDNIVDALDGRWRYILFDDDLSLSRTEDTSNISLLIRDDMLLSSILKRPISLEQFTNNICDMASYHFSKENVTNNIDYLTSKSKKEILFALDNGILGEINNMQKIESGKEQIINFCEERADYVYKELHTLFGYSEMYNIIATGPAKINTLTNGSGSYFVDNKVTLTPNLGKFEVFNYWSLNGKNIYDEELIVSVNDAINGTVNVEINTSTNYPALIFTDAHDSGDICGFSMKNPSSQPVRTDALYLSDDIYDLKKWKFPTLEIRAGREWDFVGEDSINVDTLLKILLNFNPRYGETIFLSDKDGKILDYISVE